MSSPHPSDGYRFDPATASALEAALHQAAADVQAAHATWLTGARDGIDGYGEENGPTYESKVLDPGIGIHATMSDGLALFAQQVQAWTASTTAADQDAASGFGTGSDSGSGSGSGLPVAQPGPVQTY